MVDNVRGSIVSIVIAILVIALSIPLWNLSEGKVGASIASSYADMDISVSFDGFADLLVIDDSKSNMVDDTVVSLRNPSGSDKKYDFAFAYPKDSTMDYSNIRINYNGTIYNLGEMNYIEKDNYYLFVIDSNTLTSYTNKDYKLKVYLNNDNNKLDYSSSLTATFVAI
ncbi:MAG TPA: hypothetical protein PKG93_01810 [Bacilli bacterium]|nr:hypothetical protein [Bacilli bacterium]